MNLRIIPKLRIMAYKTKQRDALLHYLGEHHDETFSVTEIAKALQGQNISLASIYRNLSELEKEGAVRKVARSGYRESYYQYVDCSSCKGHIHLSCVSCGNTEHLDEAAASSLVSSLASSAHFALDPDSTVIYGVCGECLAKQKAKGEQK